MLEGFLALRSINFELTLYDRGNEVELKESDVTVICKDTVGDVVETSFYKEQGSLGIEVYSSTNRQIHTVKVVVKGLVIMDQDFEPVPKLEVTTGLRYVDDTNFPNLNNWVACGRQPLFEKSVTKNFKKTTIGSSPCVKISAYNSTNVLDDSVFEEVEVMAVNDGGLEVVLEAVRQSEGVCVYNTTAVMQSLSVLIQGEKSVVLLQN